MAHETITIDGVIAYRTKLFRSYLQARNFAHCVEMNTSRFTDVALVESAKTKSPGWYVSFRPASKERQDALYQRQSDKREAKGKSEGQEYIFWQDADRTGVYFCFNPKSGMTYEVTCFDCTCPDYEIRCKKIGVQCKHMQAWEAQSQAGRIGKTDKVSRQ